MGKNFNYDIENGNYLSGGYRRISFFLSRPYEYSMGREYF
jgi:hypothetical protein